MCKLFYGVAVLYLACIQGSNKFCTSMFTRNTPSLYEVIKPWNDYIVDCKDQSFKICHVNCCVLQRVRNQSSRHEDLSKQILFHQHNCFLCCNFYIGVCANIRGKCLDLIFRTKSTIFRITFLMCVKNFLSDITFFKNQLLDLCGGTKVELSLDWTDLTGFDNSYFVQGFDNNYFVLFRGKERTKSVKNDDDICDISVLLASILLCTFRRRFAFCFFSISQLTARTYCSLPESFHASSSYPGGSKSPNKNSTTASKQANSLLELAKNIEHTTQSRTGKNSSSSGSQFKALIAELSDSEQNDRETQGVQDSQQPSTRRGSRSSAGLSSPLARSCSLHLVADHLFFTQVGHGNVRTTVRIMNDVIRGVDAVFRSTDFDQDGVADNLGFLVRSVTVLRDYPSSHFPYTLGSTTTAAADHVQYLRNFSTADQSRYCLAVAFTNLPFQRGVWGMVWAASSSHDASPGGICERRRRVSSAQQDSAASGATAYSFNTAAITFTDEGGQRLSKEAAVRVLSHELGHSFGSSHDDDQVNRTFCGVNSSRTDMHGMYMMNQYTTTGLQPSHYRFSPCSIRQMYPVIVHKAGCLQDHLSSQCGNGLVEEGEECDCGNVDMCDYNDPCCTPPTDVANRSAVDLPCTVRRSKGKVCSPLSGSCCLSDCQVVTNTSAMCDEATECHEQSWCDGRSGECPRPIIKPDGTSCRGGSRFCVDGQCIGSLCHRYGFLACHCTSPSSSRCELCCKASLNSECVPAQNHGIVNEQGLPIYLYPGEPCSGDSNVFCDQRRVCVPLFQVSRVTFMEQASAKSAKKHWPYLLLFLLILIFAVLFKLTSVGSESVHMQSLHYGKMMAIFMIADCIGVQNTRNIALTRYLFDRFQKKTAKNGKLQMYQFEAVSRLRTLFPTCSLSHILLVVDMASKEDVAVRVLLAQGFPSRRFIPKLTESEFAHLSHLLPRDSLKQTLAYISAGDEGSEVTQSPMALSSSHSSHSSTSAVRAPVTASFNGSQVNNLLSLQHFKTELEQSRQVLKVTDVSGDTVYGSSISHDYSQPISNKRKIATSVPVSSLHKNTDVQDKLPSSMLRVSISNESELNSILSRGEKRSAVEKPGDVIQWFDQLKQPDTDSVTPAVDKKEQEMSDVDKASWVEKKQQALLGQSTGYLSKASVSWQAPGTSRQSATSPVPGTSAPKMSAQQLLHNMHRMQELDSIHTDPSSVKKARALSRVTFSPGTDSSSSGTPFDVDTQQEESKQQKLSSRVDFFDVHKHDRQRKSVMPSQRNNGNRISKMYKAPSYYGKDHGPFSF